MRILVVLAGLSAAWAFQTPPPAPAIVKEVSHFSRVLGEMRTYRVFLPAAYAASQKRYPVIYWFHGFEQPTPEREHDIAQYVAAHDIILADVGPVELAGQFPLYFPELVEQVDRTLRTLADRGHRAVTGFATGGFMAYWIAGKYPDLVASASSFMGTPEAFVGPKGFAVEYSHDGLFANYDGVRTLLVRGTRDFTQFYHRRLNGIWMYARTGHESESFDSEHGTPGIARALDFHLHAFANPLPKPASFSHADVYPNFAVWGWVVASNRRRPGFTVLENVSSTGFRSSVREWIPDGAAIPEVKLSLASAPLYPPGSVHSVMYIRLRDGKVRRTSQRADAHGRLSFELDGDLYEVGVSPAPLIAISGYEIADAAWATAGRPVSLRVKFWNKGALRSGTSEIRWESPNAGVKFESAATRLYALGPGESATLPLKFTVEDPERAMVKILAVAGVNRMPLDLPLFPAAPPAAEFRIADGSTVNIYRHAIERADVTLGEGNGDGHAAPGETFAVLLPDAGAFRAAEVFTNDACVDNSLRASDSWADYDQAGASARYSLPSIRPDCPQGHVVHLLARVLIPNPPNHQVKYWTVELPVWWQTPPPHATIRP